MGNRSRLAKSSDAWWVTEAHRSNLVIAEDGTRLPAELTQIKELPAIVQDAQSGVHPSAHFA